LVWALVPVGCGGSDNEVAPTDPAISRQVAEKLADRAEEVASLLDQGDNCGASRVVRELRRATNRALADGSIPTELRAPIEAAVADLEGIKCIEGEGAAAAATGGEASTPTTTTAETTTTGTTTGTTTAPDTTTTPDTTTDATPTTEG
jgi:hypothetical protein